MSRHIVLLGAGISGLATAWFLKQQLPSDTRLTLLEKSARAGGWIQTIHQEGYLFEQGPRSCRSKGTGQATLELLEALNLQEEVIAPHADAKQRYIYTSQGLKRLPQHLWEIPFSPLTRGWSQALWRDWWAPKRQEADESIHSFFTRRLGPFWATQLIDPVVSGIYAGNTQTLSLKSCFPPFDQWEQTAGSLLRGMWSQQKKLSAKSAFVQHWQKRPLFSLREGMEKLPSLLAQHLSKELILNQAVERLTQHTKGITLHLANKQTLEADQVISTLPPSSLGALLVNEPEMAQLLCQLPYASLVVVHLGFPQIVSPLKGFGYLVPSSLGLPLLGCVWDSCVFPQHNQKPEEMRLTVMLGGSHHPEIMHKTEEELLAYTLEVLDKHMGIKQRPQVVRISKMEQAIPQYFVGYEAWKMQLENLRQIKMPELILSGNAFTGVSVNDCITQAKILANTFINS